MGENKAALLAIFGIGLGLLVWNKLSNGNNDNFSSSDFYSLLDEVYEKNIPSEDKSVFDGIVKVTKTMDGDYNKYEQIKKIVNIAKKNPELKNEACNAINSIAADIYGNYWKSEAINSIEKLYI